MYWYQRGHPSTIAPGAGFARVWRSSDTRAYWTPPADFLMMTRWSIPGIAIDEFLSSVVLDLYTMAKEGVSSRLSLPVISTLDSVHQVLRRPELFVKALGLLGDWGGSRFSTNGPEWAQRRTITQRAYLTAGADLNAEKIGKIYAASMRHSEPTLESVQRGFMLAAAQSFFSAFSCEVDPEPMLALLERARMLIKRLQYFTWLPPSASEREAMIRESIEIAQTLDLEVRRSAALQQLTTSFQDRSAGIDRFDPLHELLMNFLAGSETTASTLCFAIDRLGVDARVQQRIYNEVVQGKEEKYLHCFLMETLRYFPTIPFVMREATEAATLGPISVDKGQPILVSIVGLHHDAKSWNEPDVFDAARAEFLTDTYDRRAFMPFLTGPRMCGGAKLANLELREGFRAFVREFEIKNDSESVGFDYGITLRPRTAGRVSLSKRVQDT